MPEYTRNDWLNVAQFLLMFAPLFVVMGLIVWWIVWAALRRHLQQMAQMHETLQRVEILLGKMEANQRDDTRTRLANLEKKLMHSD